MRATVPGQTKIESAFAGANYAAFSKVVSLAFFEDPDEYRLDNSPSSYSLVLVLETFGRAQNYRLRMRFSKVKELSLLGFGNSLTQLTGLDIVDVSDRQMEEIKFEVLDYEDDAIRFFCDTAEVEEVERIP